jgi:hypothetical protein
MKLERMSSVDHHFMTDDSYRRPFLHIYDNPNLKPQRQLRWQQILRIGSRRGIPAALQRELFMKMRNGLQVFDQCGCRAIWRRSLILMFVIMAYCRTPAMAQRNEAGKEIAKDLLRALIESQLERQGRESYGPGRPVPPVIGEIPRPTQATREMIQIRRILASMSQDTNPLSAVVSEEGRQNPDLRRLAADMIQFQGIVRAGQQRAERENNHLAMQLAIQNMDRDWKPLAHQIGTTRSSSVTLRQTAERISPLDVQVCQIPGIRDQFNMRELVRAADVLSADN